METSIKMKLNEQINKEFYSSYLYLAMSMWAEEQGLSGMAHWLELQSQEEWAHGMKIVHHLQERDEYGFLSALSKPPADWDDAISLFEAVLGHEKGVTESVNEIVTLAKDEEDHATFSFLLWFVDEQVEEEATAREILGVLETMTTPQALLMYDNVLRKRT